MIAVRIRGVWVMWSWHDWRLSYIRAEQPCMKAEIQVGPLLLGWQSRERGAKYERH